MNTIRAIIFDLDGVICFTDQYHYQAWKAIADKLGVEFNEQINNRLRGVSRMDSLEIILERYDGKLRKHQENIHRRKKNNLPQGRMKVMFVCWKRCLRMICRRR